MAKTDTLYMRNPAMWLLNDASDAIPLGNGRTGALVKGCIGEEEIFFNRYDLWHWNRRTELPKLDGALKEARKLIDEKKYLEGNFLMYRKLIEAGYVSDPGGLMPLGALKIHFDADGLFAGYRRILHMDKGECEVVYTQGERHVVRKCFVSRKDDILYYEYCADRDGRMEIDFDFFEDGTADAEHTKLEISSGKTKETVKDGMIYRVKTESLEFGAAVRIFGAETELKDDKLHVSGSYFRLAVKCVSGKGSLLGLEMPEDFNYLEKQKQHVRLHSRLYRSADLKLAAGSRKSNEELLSEAYESFSSPELLEKMWKFGRYLFVSGTCEDGLPFPLYGIWHRKYNPGAAQHVANENVQMIYWHADVGGLSELVRPLIHYYYSHMEEFRENAEKVYGCKGIFVGTYTDPGNFQLSLFVPVILHFTGVAGWLSQHFYKYYRMTGDQKLLREEIFPFMLAAADFYLDFITYDENGKVQVYPSVSPENSPANLMHGNYVKMQHPNPAVKNATIEIAIIKELFTNILTLIEETGEHGEYRAPIREVLGKLPEYAKNEDGAIKEWLCEEFQDSYHHRHLSHIYPLFPGEEVSEETDPELYHALERAVDLRELDSQTGWSLAHMASIYATLKRPEKVMECLDALIKSCTMPNFFTMHNDYRDMGLTLTTFDDRYFTQLDANMGFVNAMQKMLLDERCGCVELLPALPERLKKGSAKDFCFTAGRIKFNWDVSKSAFRAAITFSRQAEIKLKLPAFCKGFTVEAHGAEYTLSENILIVKAQKGGAVKVTSLN